jgi:acyl-CoA synthetase (NDP forming)
MAAGVPVDVTGRPTELRDVDLRGFFSPQTVAVIGASDNPKRPNAAMTHKIVAWAEEHGATVHLVNPNRDTIDGRPCFTSVLDVPGDVDLAVILVRDAVDAYEEVLAKKARFAVIFSAGFAETGRAVADLQARREAPAATAGTHVVRPHTNRSASKI